MGRLRSAGPAQGIKMTKIKAYPGFSGECGTMPPLVAYALLVFVLTVPFWIAGWVFDISILPGLPLAVFAIFVPSLAAAIVIGRTDGRSAVAALFDRVREVTALPALGWLGALAVP